ncbi:MAG: hypothetical protein ABGY42_03700, partial [bacterium]
MKTSTLAALAAILTSSLLASPARADQVILDDLIVDGSTCVGMDCVNGEEFDFDTIRLKENNLRISFIDTSSTASFAGADWQIIVNDSTNGGDDYFGIADLAVVSPGVCSGGPNDGGACGQLPASP